MPAPVEDRPPMAPRPRLRRLAQIAAVAGAGAAAWEVQRRIDARRVAADPQTAELQRDLQGRPTEVRSADGTRIHVEVFGPEDAPTIVLVHGWTCALAFWHYQVVELSREFRVVAYDQRGHGRSEAPRGRAYTDQALSDDLEAVLQATVPAGQRCVVAGHSMGGMTVVAWAGRHREELGTRLAAAALVDTGMGHLTEQALVLPRWGGPLYRSLAPHLTGSPGPLPRTSTPLVHRALRRIAFGDGASAAHVAFAEKMLLECPARARAGFGRFFSDMDLSTSVPALDVPTLVMVGEKDRLTPPWHARRLAESLPQVEAVVEVPGKGHMLPLESHALVSRSLAELARTHLRDAAAPAKPSRRQSARVG